MDCRLQAFGGLRGSLFTSLWWQIESFTSLWGHTWIGVYMPLVSHVDRRLQALDGFRGSPFTSLWWQMESFKSLWWHTWILVPQAFGGRWRHLQAFGGIRGSSCTRLLVAYVDRHVEAFGGIRGLPIASLWWLTWIAVHKPLVADGVVYKPSVGYVDYHI